MGGSSICLESIVVNNSLTVNLGFVDTQMML